MNDTKMTDRELILAFFRGLSLADHIGDVASDVEDLIRRMNIVLPDWHSFEELSDILKQRDVPYLHEIK